MLHVIANLLLRCNSVFVQQFASCAVCVVAHTCSIVKLLLLCNNLRNLRKRCSVLRCYNSVRNTLRNNVTVCKRVKHARKTKANCKCALVFLLLHCVIKRVACLHFCCVCTALLQYLYYSAY